MTHVEPTLPAPMPPSTIDFAAVFAVQAEQAVREAELRPANKDRLFDALTAAGISHVTVTFDGEGDSGGGRATVTRVEGKGRWRGRQEQRWRLRRGWRVTKRTRASKRATNHFILNWNKMFDLVT